MQRLLTQAVWDTDGGCDYLRSYVIERVEQAAIPIDWVVADTVYGGNFDLRNFLEGHRYHYALAVACTEPVALHTPQGRARVEAAQVEMAVPGQFQWQRLSMSQGTK